MKLSTALKKLQNLTSYLNRTEETKFPCFYFRCFREQSFDHLHLRIFPEAYILDKTLRIEISDPIDITFQSHSKSIWYAMKTKIETTATTHDIERSILQLRFFESLLKETQDSEPDIQPENIANVLISAGFSEVYEGQHHTLYNEKLHGWKKPFFVSHSVNGGVFTIWEETEKEAIKKAQHWAVEKNYDPSPNCFTAHPKDFNTERINIEPKQ